MDKVYFHFLLGSGKLTPYAGFIQKNLESHLEKLVQKLPLTNVDIIVEHDPNSVIPETGYGGWCSNQHVIHLAVDVDRVNFKQIVEETLYGALAHEGHHLFRWRGPGYGYTLKEAIISEGLACHCEEECTGKRQPWNHALSVTQINKYLSIARRLRKKQYNHNDWFFGTKKTLPRWTGYTLGYFLVGNYLNAHPKETAISLCNSSADIFWKQ